MKSSTHKGPHPGILAIIFCGLFILGLSFVISFNTGVHFPGPTASALTITDYFRLQSHQVLLCAFFQFGSAIPLGLLTVVLVSRLQFAGIRAPGTYIAFFGGISSAISIMISSTLLWVMTVPGIAENASVIRPLYFSVYAIGGVGYSVPLGLLIAGISVTSAFARFLPVWLWLSGVIIALIGELSWLTMLYPRLLPLIPLTRFPGFVWLIFIGFRLRTKV